MSTTSHRVDDVVPSNETPIIRRVMLRPPSQPTTYRARMLDVLPSLPHSTITPVASGTHELIGRFHCTSTCSNLSSPRSNSASTSGCTNPLRLGQPKRASGGAISASTRRLASKKRRIWLGTVCGRICSTRPIDWNVRNDSSSSPTPRG
ncbi:Uncharacterised protein [Mycobacterium tuberculosis]|nr:Uncharacterised protein [Mycobacterium tuberculosis]